MTTLADIREALTDTLADCGVQVLAYPPGSVPSTPCIFPGLRKGRRATQDGGDTVELIMWAVVSPTVTDQFDELDRLIDGEQSVVDVLDAAPDLGLGSGVSASVSGEWSEHQVEVGGDVYPGVQFTVEVRF